MTTAPLFKKSKVNKSHDCHTMNLNEMPDLIARVLINDSSRNKKQINKSANTGFDLPIQSKHH